MKKMYLTLLLLITCLMLNTPAYADVNYQVYRAGGPTPCFGCGQVLSSGSTSNINFNWGGGAVMGTGYADGVEIHFTGYITVPGSGAQTITFYDSSDDGFILNVGGTRVISNWVEQGPSNFNGWGTITLQGGQTYAIDVWWYENGGGAAVSLYWNQSGAITLIPNANYFTTPPNPKVFGDGGGSLPSTSISSSKQTKITAASTATTIGGSIYIDQQGYSPTIIVEQSSMYNSIRGINGYQAAHIYGDYNYVNIYQGGGNVIGHNTIDLSVDGNNNVLNMSQNYSYKYVEIAVTGSGNNIALQQKDNSAKNAFVNVVGSTNILNILQQGTGNHYVDLTVPTNSNNVSITQSGAAQKLFSLIINSPNVGVTVSQTNATVSDSATMSITCTTGPCNGYSYTKN